MSQDFNRILERVAENNGTTVTEVRREIEAVIDSCWDNPDPAIHARWEAMSPTGTRPTVEEAVLYLSALAAEGI